MSLGTHSEHQVSQPEYSESLSEKHASELLTENSNPEDEIDDEWRALGLELSETESDVQRRKGFKYKLAKTFWDTADKSQAERTFMFKLDFFFLTTACFGYFIKNLDQRNVNTAFNNGMDEYYKMKGNDLQVLQTCWTVGYIIGQIPAQLLLHHFPANYFLGVLEIIWSILTLLCIACPTLNGLYAVRFFVGLVEAGYFPSVEVLLGSWYSSDEIVKRSTLFAVSGIAASMIIGPLQTGIIDGLSGKGFAEPFKWLFVINFVISLPLAIYTLLTNPDIPETTKAFYFNKKDKQIALFRRMRIGARPKKRFTLGAVKRAFSSWHVYVFPYLFLCYNNSAQSNSQPVFQQWLKQDLKMSYRGYNDYPSAVNGTGIGLALVFSWISDYIGGITWPFILLYFVCAIIGNSLLSAWDINRGAHWFAYFLVGAPTAWGMPMIFPWVNQLLRADNEKRHIVVVLTNNLAYITDAFVPVLVWNAGTFPRAFTGFTYTACLTAMGLLLTIVAIIFYYHDLKRQTSFDAEAPEFAVKDSKPDVSESTLQEEKGI